jgi:trk system potassium uptake protein TrkA
LCHRLEDKKLDLILLEEDQDTCERAAERLPRAAVVRGSPLDRDLMLDMKVNESSFFALSAHAASNFASAVFARRLGAHRAVMLATEPEQVALFDRPPVDAVVNPVTLSVGAILRSVRAGRVVVLFRLAGREGEAFEIEAQPGAPGIGRPLREVRFPFGAVVAAVTGAGGPRVATGETVISPGDHVIVVAQSEVVNDAIALFSSVEGTASGRRSR